MNERHTDDKTQASMRPVVFLACTYNLWGEFQWEGRRRSLERFMEVQRPDILCVQELSPKACVLIAETLPGMRRVDDPFPGWTVEGNVFWNSDIFELVEYGAEDIKILEKHRRLFWVRLSMDAGKTLVVSTAHFTYPGNEREIAEQINVRMEQAEAAAGSLDGLVHPDEPVLFMGDFNDYLLPPQILRDAGFEDSFRALGREPAITYRAFPTTNQPPAVLDWMMHRGPIRPTLTSVVDFHVERIPPSDHKPILTTYVLEQSSRVESG